MLDDGEGKLEFSPLPRLAQIAPSFGLPFLDANGGGKIDLQECPVVEIPGRRGARTWQRRITVAPERSWLPVEIVLFVKDAMHSRHVLDELEKVDGEWIPKQIRKTHFQDGIAVQTRQIRINEVSLKNDVHDLQHGAWLHGIIRSCRKRHRPDRGRRNLHRDLTSKR